MRGPGFEPGLTPRKGVVLPLDYPRLLFILLMVKNVFDEYLDFVILN